MSTVVQVAIVLHKDYILTRKYNIDDVFLEYAFRLYGSSFDDLIWDIDDENVLDEVKSACTPDQWQRALALVILWHLDGLQSTGYFSEIT